MRDKRRRNLLFGWDFLALFDRKRRELLEPVRRGRDFFQSVKSDMGTNRVYPFSKLPNGRTPVEITARLLEQLVRLVSQDNPDLDPRKGHVIITVPALFSALARKDTLDAAESAGFSRDRVALLDEPVAALLDTVNHQDAGGLAVACGIRAEDPYVVGLPGVFAAADSEREAGAAIRQAPRAHVAALQSLPVKPRNVRTSLRVARITYGKRAEPEVGFVGLGALLGRRRSAKKAAAARANGRKGRRPRTIAEK